MGPMGNQKRALPEAISLRSKHPISEWKGLWERGWSFSQIAEHYGVTRNTVAGAKMRIANPEHVLAYAYDRGRRKSTIAWQQELDERRARYGHLLEVVAPGRKHTILCSFLAGKTDRETAAALGITRQAVNYHLASIGIANSRRSLCAKTRPA
jgi:hypothetical protein